MLHDLVLVCPRSGNIVAAEQATSLICYFQAPSNILQYIATYCKILHQVAKCVQHVVHKNVALIFVEVLRAFGQLLKFSKFQEIVNSSKGVYSK